MCTAVRPVRQRQRTRIGVWAWQRVGYTVRTSMTNNVESLSGVVERITFHNLDNGYSVLKVLVPAQREVFTVVGTISSVVAGEYIEARGTWINDRTHGMQFKADELKT